MFIIKLDDVLTMSESSDIEMIMMYQQFCRSSEDRKTNGSPISRKMGYLGKVSDTKELLEKLYKKNQSS